jgi:hypothetical protein
MIVNLWSLKAPRSTPLARVAWDPFFRSGRSIPPDSSPNFHRDCVHFRYFFRSVSTKLPLKILSVFSAEIKLTLYLDRNDFRIFELMLLSELR